MKRKHTNAAFKRYRRVFIREWRKHADLTQEQLAEKVDRSPSWVSQIENGEIGFTEESLSLLADALGCEPADFLKGPPVEAEQPLALPEVFHSLSPAEQEQAIAVMEALRKRA